MAMEKKLPVGIESFEKIRKEGFYYIDKTGIIAELLNSWGEVNLFTRPRRFGKSLNMSMLKCFFEPGCERALFEGLRIWEEKELCEKYMGQFPVIFISLKGVDGAGFGAAQAMLRAVIGKEAMRFQFLMDSERLEAEEKLLYKALTGIDAQGRFTMSDELLNDSLLTLSQLLYKHYGHKTIILIDEYDVPLDKAYQSGYYDAMVKQIRSLFVQGLKGNESMYFAVLTGCLRISKESIFTGLNNPKVSSVTNVRYDEYFGFTDPEVRELLGFYGLTASYDTIREWYDGYRFGNVDVYCPWDVISYCDDLRANPDAGPQNYWINTSSNDIVKKFIRKAKAVTKKEIEELVAGGSVKKAVREELTYHDLDSSIDNLWSMLFTTGYLTQRGKRDGDRLNLVIPNKEIGRIFTVQIMEWFEEEASRDSGKLRDFCMAFQNGDADEIEARFQSYLQRTISIRDTNVRKERKEHFYHGILLGLLSHMEDWSVVSNAEAGEGYSDILIEIEDLEIGIVIEVKYAEKGALEEGCRKALKQIGEQQYEEALLEDGMRTVLKYGIACYKKRCRVIRG